MTDPRNPPRLVRLALSATLPLLMLGIMSTQSIHASPDPRCSATPDTTTSTLLPLTLGLAYSFAWNQEGTMLAVAAAGGIGLFDESLVELERLPDCLHFTSPIVWSPDGQRMAYTRADGHGIVRARADNSMLALAYPTATGPSLIHPRLFSSDMRQVFGDIQVPGQPSIQALGVWDGSDGRLIEERRPALEANQTWDTLYDAAWTEAGLTLLIGVRGEHEGTYVWLPDGALMPLQMQQNGQVIAAGGARFSADGQSISARLPSVSGVGIWSIDQLSSLDRFYSPVTAGPVQVHTSDGLLIGGEHGELQFWNPTGDGTQPASFSIETSRVLDAAWQPTTPRFATLGQDGVIRLYDTSSGRRIHALHLFAHVDNVAWSFDGTRITAWSNHATDNVSITFNAANGSVVSASEQALNVSQPFVMRQSSSIVWSFDGAWAAWVQPDGTGLVFQRGQPEPLLRLDGTYRGFAWSPAQSTLAAYGSVPTAGLEIYRDVSADGPADVVRLDPPGDESDFVRAIAWSPDGAALAVAVGETDLTIIRYSFSEQKWSDTVFSQSRHTGEVNLDWRSMGELLVSPAQAVPVILDPRTGTVIGPEALSSDPLTAAQWNVNMSLVAGVSHDAGNVSLRILRRDGELEAEYAMANLDASAGTVPLQWSPDDPWQLALLDDRALYRWRSVSAVPAG